MMKVILDSSFIISCVREGIDFIQQLSEQGFELIAPREVLQEMKDLRNSERSSQKDRTAIDVALQLVETKKLKKMSFGQGKVDDFLIQKGNEGYHIATLDKLIKKNVPKRIVIFTSKKSVGVE